MRFAPLDTAAMGRNPRQPPTSPCVGRHLGQDCQSQHPGIDDVGRPILIDPAGEALPLLDGPNGSNVKSAELARDKQRCPKSPWQQVAGLFSFREGVGQVEMQNGLDVKAMSESGKLAKYRIVHFATHGVMAGELGRSSEPGLILTPPDTASEDDDGYLSASEIAGLKLDADWVILSACNTAAGQALNAEALSGLANSSTSKYGFRRGREIRAFAEQCALFNLAACRRLRRPISFWTAAGHSFCPRSCCGVSRAMLANTFGRRSAKSPLAVSRS
jgi:hypothetical protein